METVKLALTAPSAQNMQLDHQTQVSCIELRSYFSNQCSIELRLLEAIHLDQTRPPISRGFCSAAEQVYQLI